MDDFTKAPWGKPWFSPKRFGYGAGLPCSWEGWVALAVFVVTAMGWALAMKGRAQSLGAAGGAIVVIAVFVIIARGRTAGGWRWRSGRD